MDREIRILHGADFHLDARPPSFLSREAAVQRIEERFGTFERVMRMAAEERVQYVLIAGDLLENEHVRRQTVRRVCEVFARLAPAWVLVAPGNHDPQSPESFYGSYDWPANVHIFPSGWSTWCSPDGLCTVTGFGWDRSEVSEALLRQCPPVETAGTRIVIVHGDSLAVNGKSIYLPIAQSDLEACPADYVALGHVHRAEPAESGPLKQKWMNPGAPEPLDFGEAEQVRGVVCGNVSRGGSDLRLVSFPPRREYRVRQIRVDGLDGEHAVSERVRSSLPKEQRDEDMFRLILTGMLDPSVRLSISDLAALLKNDFYSVDIQDQTHSCYDIEAISREEGLRGEFVRVMLSRMAAAGAPVDDLQRAIEIGLEAMEGRDVNAAIV